MAENNKFDDILGTVGNTPVIRINKLGPEGVNLYVKSEAFNPMSSVKDRLALGIIEHAERTGALQPGQTVVEATSGNTGIALAFVCAVKDGDRRFLQLCFTHQPVSQSPAFTLDADSLFHTTNDVIGESIHDCWVQFGHSHRCN